MAGSRQSATAERDQLRAAAGQADELQKVLSAAQSQLDESRAQAARGAEQLASQIAEVTRLNRVIEAAGAEGAAQLAAVRQAAANAARLQQQLTATEQQAALRRTWSG